MESAPSFSRIVYALVSMVVIASTGCVSCTQPTLPSAVSISPVEGGGCSLGGGGGCSLGGGGGLLSGRGGCGSHGGCSRRGRLLSRGTKKLSGLFGGGCGCGSSGGCDSGFSAPVSSRGSCDHDGGCGCGLCGKGGVLGNAGCGEGLQGGLLGGGCGAGGCGVGGLGIADHLAAQTAQMCEGGFCNRPYPPGMGPGGLPGAQVRYPYYTTRGPRDFLMANPPSIGP